MANYISTILLALHTLSCSTDVVRALSNDRNSVIAVTSAMGGITYETDMDILPNGSDYQLVTRPGSTELKAASEQTKKSIRHQPENYIRYETSFADERIDENADKSTTEAMNTKVEMESRNRKMNKKYRPDTENIRLKSMPRRRGENKENKNWPREQREGRKKENPSYPLEHSQPKVTELHEIEEKLREAMHQNLELQTALNFYKIKFRMLQIENNKLKREKEVFGRQIDCYKHQTRKLRPVCTGEEVTRDDLRRLKAVSRERKEHILRHAKFMSKVGKSTTKKTTSKSSKSSKKDGSISGSKGKIWTLKATKSKSNETQNFNMSLFQECAQCIGVCSEFFMPEDEIAETPTPSMIPSAFPSFSPSSSPTSSPGGPCGVTRDERRDLILDVLQTVSDETLLSTIGTPQSNAKDWLLDEDGLQLCHDNATLVQRYVLAVFYFSTSGDSWEQCSAVGENSQCDGAMPYLSEVSECSWFGSSCRKEDSKSITDISLGESIGLKGSIPSELASLSCLLTIELEGRGLEGNLPAQLFAIQTLVGVDISNTRLDGTISASVGLATSLQSLILSNGNFDGELPAALFTLTGLRRLRLNGNDFFGQFQDSAFADMTNLSEINFARNGFDGSIPGSLGSLHRLALLDLSFNSFFGMMPSLLGDALSLRVLNLNHNMLEGQIPTEMGNLELLYKFAVECNMLSGEMPSSVCMNSPRALSANCQAPNNFGPPPLECSCCTDCFSAEFCPI